MISSVSDLNEITSAKAAPKQVSLSGPPTHGPGGMGTIRGLIVCEPAGSYDFQDLLVEIDSKRVKTKCEIDDQGRFAIDNLPQGRYYVYIREALTLYQIICPGDQVQIDANHPEQEVILQVSRPVAVTVLASEQGTHQPVSGLPIHVWSARGPGQTSSTTDLEGQCELELAPGQYLVETSVHTNGKSVRIGPEPLTVVGRGSAKQFALSIPALPPALLPKAVNTLDCLLVDSTGSPIPGYVRISGIYRSNGTEPNTHFVIPILTNGYPGEWFIGQAYDSFGILARRFLYRRDKTDSLLEIVLEQRATITGRVVDPNGQPIPDAYLDLETPPPDDYFRGGDDSIYKLSLANDGRFVFTDVPIGLPVKVVAGATGRSQGQSRILDLKPARIADVGDIVLTARKPQNGVIAGWVIDENGSPIPKCPVWAGPVTNRPTALTQEDGRFTLEHLSKDEDVSVTIDLPGYGQWSKTTRADDHSFNLQVFPEGWQVIGNQAPPLLAAQWWNSQPVSLEQTRGKVVVLALGADPFIDPQNQLMGPSMIPSWTPIRFSQPLMDIHRRFGGTRVQVIIVLTSVPAYPPAMDRVRQVLEDGYLETNDLTFAACVDEDPNRVAPLQPEGSRSRGATYTLYQARRPNTLVLIDKQGIVRAFPQPKDLDDYVQRLVEE